MPSVKISEDAMREILQRLKGKPTVNEKSIPLLAWSQRVYTDDHHGNHKELGPKFFLFWTNQAEVEENGYVTMPIAEGHKLALAPGAVFQSGSKRIELKDHQLTLVNDKQLYD
jgi:hypothetical protein